MGCAVHKGKQMPNFGKTWLDGHSKFLLHRQVCQILCRTQNKATAEHSLDRLGHPYKIPTSNECQPKWIPQHYKGALADSPRNKVPLSFP